VVEIHGANGYLMHQFVAAGSNHRDDAYGGSVASRARLAIEVVEVVAAEIGA
jgi:N-ethylmaleimide reductase